MLFHIKISSTIFIALPIHSDSLFKVLFWKFFVQQIIYYCFGEFNLNNQVIFSNNFILLTSDVLTHSDSISENFPNK